MNSRVLKIITATVVFAMSVSCGSKDFQLSEDGYEYKYIIKGVGKTPKIGETAVYNIMYKNEKDSVLFNPKTMYNVEIPCTVEWGSSGALFKSFQRIKEGDSILIRIPTKTFFSEPFKQPIPPELDALGYITVCIGAEKINIQKKDEVEKMSYLNTDIEIIEDYLKENNITAQSTGSGLRYVIKNEGTGDHPQAGQIVSVHCAGTLMDGTEFYSTYSGNPLSFAIGRGKVIEGWDEGIPLLKKGGKGTLYIPSHLAYGPAGRGKNIGPNSILKFEVELIDVQ
ncbi:MAG: FKBP-type peptidyl-prolyl cis-trans isomerase [Psychroserpens sp.]|jgi:FKBP-type peptidyl-prolyl cis-trans isomerase|uniref:FKBP-type peptidyl-prolyl cis-trans isomerase n=1 Tax=Psychroserpens sp. TaxID=2020870 RepID=UPI0039E62C8D